MEQPRAKHRRWGLFEFVRDCVRRVPGIGFDQDDPTLKELNFWTLSFSDPMREQAFVRKRMNSLRSNSLKLCCICLVFSSWGFVFSGFDTRTSAGAFSDAAGSDLVLARNAVCLCFALGLISGIVVFASTRVANCMGPRGVELFAAFYVSFAIVGQYFMTPWYMTKIWLYDAWVVINTPLTHDLVLILHIDAVITATHIALPIRWVLLIPSHLAGTVVYVALASSLGSPLPKYVLANFVFIAAMTFAASMGLRSAEVRERAACLSWLEERCLRAQAEHTVDTLSKKQVEHDAKRKSNCTGMIFDGVDGLDERAINRRLQTIADFGAKEHWLIDSKDIMVYPSRVLGRGGFGLVMEGSYHGATVAVKGTIPHGGESLHKAIDSQVNELRMFRRLRHPNIVLFYGAVLLPRTFDIVLIMELVQGARLDLLALPPPEGPGTRQRCKLMKDLCCALVYLHSQEPQLVHGDIKDTNAVVEFQSATAALNVKLLDFGLGRVLTRAAKPLGGTLVWRAPELLQPRAVSPHTSADIFSLGRLLFKIITGRRPLSGWRPQDIKQVAREHMTVLEDWPDVPLAEEVKTLSERCIQFHPHLRPSIFELQELLQLACGLWRPAEEPSYPLDMLRDELHRIHTNSPGASDHGGLPMYQPLRPMLEQEEPLADGDQPSPCGDDAAAMKLITQANWSGERPVSKLSL